jgi:preprotein translocase subunit SecG
LGNITESRLPTLKATYHPTVTATPFQTVTATPFLTVTGSPLPTLKATYHPTVTATPFPTVTATPFPTVTATPFPTGTATPSPTKTPFPTQSDVPPAASVSPWPDQTESIITESDSTSSVALYSTELVWNVDSSLSSQTSHSKDSDLSYETLEDLGSSYAIGSGGEQEINDVDGSGMFMAVSIAFLALFMMLYVVMVRWEMTVREKRKERLIEAKKKQAEKKKKGPIITYQQV